MRRSRMIAIVKAAGTTARAGIDDADIAGSAAAGAAADALPQRLHGQRAGQAFEQFVEVDAHHAPAVDAHCEQFEMRGEFR